LPQTLGQGIGSGLLLLGSGYGVLELSRQLPFHWNSSDTKIAAHAEFVTDLVEKDGAASCVDVYTGYGVERWCW
jgi:uncharacterized membrane protein YcjF (UPF0283 family)